MPRKRKDDEIAPAVTELEEDVIFGRLRPFEPITEEDVMMRFGLTRHMSRRVFQRLEELGILASARAGGTVVRAFSIEEIEQIYEVRELLQEQAMRRMPLPSPADLVALLRQVHRRYIGAVRADDLTAIFRANEEFHDLIFGACGNPVLADAIKKYTWLTHGVRSRVFTSRAHLAKATDDHARLLDALEEGDRETLVEINRIHVNRPKEAYLRSSSGIGAAGAPRASRPAATIRKARAKA